MLLPCVAGLLLSLFLFHVDTFPYDPGAVDDQGLFQRIAANLYQDGSFSGATGESKPFCPVRPPLYPIIIALLMKISGEYWITMLRIIQLSAYVATIWMTGRISFQLTGSKMGALLSSTTIALMPHVAALTHVILTESFTIFILVFCMFIMVKIHSSNRLSLYLILAVSLGLLILMRPTFFFFPICAFIYLLPLVRSYKHSLVCILLCCLVLVLVLFPWSFVNYRAGQRVTSFGFTAVGFNLMAGIIKSTPVLHRELEEIAKRMNDRDRESRLRAALLAVGEQTSRANDHGGLMSNTAKERIAASCLIYADAWKQDPPPAGHIIAANEFLRKTARDWIWDHPIEYLAVMKNNLKVMLFGEYQPLIYHRLTGALFMIVSSMNIVLYILGFTGFIAAFLKRQASAIHLPLIVVCYLLVIHMPMLTEPRYFVEAYPSMALAVPYILSKR